MDVIRNTMMADAPRYSNRFTIFTKLSYHHTFLVPENLFSNNTSLFVDIYY